MPVIGRQQHFRRVNVDPQRSATAVGGGGGAGRGGAVDALEDKVVTTAADTRLRTSALASAGPTKTQVPDLVGDWRKALLESAAKDAARQEMWGDVEIALDRAEMQKGSPLDDDEREQVVDDFFDQNAARLHQLVLTYHADMQKNAERTVQKVISEERPRINTRRDPFTPIAQKDPQARAREMVLWESPQAMVLVDLFAPSPKALVVPKQPLMLPVDAQKPLLDELALLSAHVSDALNAAHKTPPAGIWVNPPQDVTVRQLHVHVMPDLPRWRDLLGVPNARDPAARQAVANFFDGVRTALETKLGPST